MYQQPAESAQQAARICSSCGLANEPDATYCGNCGNPLIQSQTPVVEEHVLGGFTSSNLRKGVWGLRALGYGIYITERRIVGVVSTKGRAERAGDMIGGGLVGAMARGLVKEHTPTTIQELDKRKDFEIYKDNISTIEIEHAHLKITPVTGEPVTITIFGEMQRQELIRLMNMFCTSSLSLRLLIAL